ncbi:hypothetical protein ACFLU5_13585 [Bacteroidota bacterium]
MHTFKWLISLPLFLSLAFPVNGQHSDQPQTLTGDIHTNSGYGGPVIKYTMINDEGALLVGGYGGWFINDAIMLGIGGYGLTSDIPVADQDRTDTTTAMTYDLGYGGLMLEFTVKSKKLIHISFGSLIGGGGIVQISKNSYDVNETSLDGGGYFVTEPFLNLELNITRFFRISAGGGYRFTVGTYSQGITAEDLNTFSGNLAFKFGWF